MTLSSCHFCYCCCCCCFIFFLLVTSHTRYLATCKDCLSFTQLPCVVVYSCIAAVQLLSGRSSMHLALRVSKFFFLEYSEEMDVNTSVYLHPDVPGKITKYGFFATCLVLVCLQLILISLYSLFSWHALLHHFLSTHRSTELTNSSKR